MLENHLEYYDPEVIVQSLDKGDVPLTDIEKTIAELADISKKSRSKINNKWLRTNINMGSYNLAIGIHEKSKDRIYAAISIYSLLIEQITQRCYAVDRGVAYYLKALSFWHLDRVEYPSDALCNDRHYLECAEENINLAVHCFQGVHNEALFWGRMNNHLGEIYVSLHFRSTDQDLATLMSAIAAYKRTIEGVSKNHVIFDLKQYIDAQMGIGNASQLLAEWSDPFGTSDWARQFYKDSIAAYRQTLYPSNAERASAYGCIADSLFWIARRSYKCEPYKEAIFAYFQYLGAVDFDPEDIELCNSKLLEMLEGYIQLGGGIYRDDIVGLSLDRLRDAHISLSWGFDIQPLIDKIENALREDD